MRFARISARANGQYITVLPALDMVVAHKMAVPTEKSVPWSDYQGILDWIVQARTQGK